MSTYILSKKRSPILAKDFADAIENIDIGGPSMLRSAAKNFNDVTVVVDKADYEKVLAELNNEGNTTLATRKN